MGSNKTFSWRLEFYTHHTDHSTFHFYWSFALMMTNSYMSLFALLRGRVRKLGLGFGLEKKESSNEDQREWRLIGEWTLGVKINWVLALWLLELFWMRVTSQMFLCLIWQCKKTSTKRVIVWMYLLKQLLQSISWGWDVLNSISKGWAVKTGTSYAHIPFNECI